MDALILLIMAFVCITAKDAWRITKNAKEAKEAKEAALAKLDELKAEEAEIASLEAALEADKARARARGDALNALRVASQVPGINTVDGRFAFAEALGVYADALEEITRMTGSGEFEMTKAAVARANHVAVLEAAIAEDDAKKAKRREEEEAKKHGLSRPMKEDDMETLLDCLGINAWDPVSVARHLLLEDSNGDIPLERAKDGCDAFVLLTVGFAEEQVSKLRTDRARYFALRAIAMMNDDLSYHEISREHRSIIEKLMWQRTPLMMDDNDYFDYETSLVLRLLHPVILDMFQDRMLHDKVNEAVILGLRNRS
jgi:hypothetical protein